jgi:hypothetical protein
MMHLACIYDLPNGNTLAILILLSNVVCYVLTWDAANIGWGGL